MDEDEDVIWAGSPLDEHLQQQQQQQQQQQLHHEPMQRNRNSVRPKPKNRLMNAPDQLISPKIEFEVGKKLLGSELLVQEDEHFVTNFILSANDPGKESGEKSANNGLTDALLFGGSVALGSGIVYYLSERTKLAAAMASIIPSTLAALSALRNAKNQPETDLKEEEFQRLIDQLLTDMKEFKKLIRKSLNLLQGMEIISSGYLLYVNSNGSPAEKVSGNHEERSGLNSFPALRKAAYESTVELIRTYRQSIRTLMDISPLSDHVDFKEHYIAFIDLEQFGVVERREEHEVPSVNALKDVVQLGLVQQSEYLRRFALSFSSKGRDEDKEKEVKSGLMLKHIRDLVGTVRKINSKLSKVFEYHQAMGMTSENKKRSPNPNHQLLPLRTVYTSLFSTGLHLQNSLLKIRDLEQAFEFMEKKKTKNTDMIRALIPNDESVVQWLNGFKGVQSDLNACIDCLDEGICQMNSMRDKDDETVKEEVDKVEIITPTTVDPKVTIDDDFTPDENLDEVFEAVIKAEEKFEETQQELDEYLLNQKFPSQSDRVIEELKVVLVERSLETDRREALALQRRNKGRSVINTVKEKIQSDKDDEAFLLRNDNQVNKDEDNDAFENDFVTSPTTTTGVLLLSNSESSSTLNTVKSKSNSVDSIANDDSGSGSDSEVECLNDGQKVMKATVLKKNPSLEHLGGKNISANLRSLSSPDINKDNLSSPYVTLTMTSPLSESDSSSSDDETGDSRVKRPFRRPPRPELLKNQIRNGLPQNNYVQKHHRNGNPLFVPQIPVGISALAGQVAQRAKVAQEEVFGESD